MHAGERLLYALFQFGTVMIVVRLLDVSVGNAALLSASYGTLSFFRLIHI